MTGVETTAMLPVKEYLKTTGEITGYLINRNLIPEADLPYHLFLGPYSSIMQRLYAQSRQVFIENESQRNERFKDAEEMKRRYPPTTNPLLKIAFHIFNKEFIQMINKKAEGERGIVVFMDSLTQEISTTDIAHGEYCSVYLDSPYALISSGKLPLMRQHTHPDDALFSPTDYFNLITNYDGNGRGIKAEMVLCPNLQVLALATDKTILLPSGEARRLIGDWESIPQGESDAEGKAIASAMEQLEIEVRRNHKEDLESIVNLTQTLTRGIPPSRKERRRLEREKEEILTAAQSRARRFEQALAELINKETAFGNTKLLEFARMINVALYISTNTVDFYRFSA